MNEETKTSVSLFLRLQDSNNPRAEQDWNRFVSIYGPMVLMWAKNKQFQEEDAQDLVQEVLIKMHNALLKGQVDLNQRFRGYLFTTTLNAARTVLKSRKKRPLSGMELDETMFALESDADLFAETEYRNWVVNRCLQLMKDMDDAKWQICRRIFIEGKNASEIAEELGIEKQSVYTTKSRVLQRLRIELTDLVDDL